MKKFVQLTGFVCIIALISAFSFLSGCTKELDDMADSRDVRVSVSGSNDFTAVSIRAENTGASAVEFIIPRGIVLRSSNPSAQPMVVAVGRKVQLAGYETRVITVPAFCMDFFRDTPLSQDSFGITGYTRADNPDLIKFLDYLESSAYNLEGAGDRKIAQYAVWLLVNNLDSRRFVSYGVDDIVAQRRGIRTADKEQRHAAVVSLVGQARYDLLLNGFLETADMKNMRTKVNNLLSMAAIARTW